MLITTHQTNTPIRIIILDNQTLLRVGVRSLIKDHPWLQVVGEVGMLDKSIEIVTLPKPVIFLFEFNLLD